MQGKIVGVAAARGFAFVAPDGGGRDIFVHASEVRGANFSNLATGDRVEFELEPGPRGPRAVGVRLVDATL